jgi:hypothetical protein
MRRKQAQAKIHAKAIGATFDPTLWLAATVLSAAAAYLACLI